MHDIDLRSLHAKRPEKYYLENAAVSQLLASGAKWPHTLLYLRSAGETNALQLQWVPRSGIKSLKPQQDLISTL